MTLAERIHNYFKTGRELNVDTLVSTIRVGMSLRRLGGRCRC